MANPVIILHGWNDTSQSFIGLGQWLKANGFNVVDIYLADYLTMNDEITLYDLGLAFKRALDLNKIPQARYSFDAIVHSTGGLVVREFLRQFCAGNAAATPVQRLVMMSPANFGSQLATLGRSVLGRLTDGWGWNHLGQTGQQVLNALELASPYTWELAAADLFTPGFRIFDPANVLITILGGTAAYANALKATLHEDGSDGVVRAAAANLNAHYLKLDFTIPGQPQLTETLRSCPQLAFAVFNRDHTAMHDPADPREADEWKNLVLAALAIDAAGYANHVQNCAALSQATFAAGLASPNPDWYHQYQHVVFRVRDQFGLPVEDYVVEFYQETGDDNDAVFQAIHGDILEKVTTNTIDSSYRSFFFNTDDLNAYLAGSRAEVDLSLSAANISANIGYQNPAGGLRIFSPTLKDYIHPNEPMLVDVLMNRIPGPEVFTLRRQT